jgi:hypothetical protein
VNKRNIKEYRLFKLEEDLKGRFLKLLREGAKDKLFGYYPVSCSS